MILVMSVIAELDSLNNTDNVLLMELRMETMWTIL